MVCGHKDKPPDVPIKAMMEEDSKVDDVPDLGMVDLIGLGLVRRPLLLLLLMNMLVWNCRGTGMRSFPSLMKDLCRKHKFDFLALVETRQSGLNAELICRKLGFLNWSREEAEGYSGGIWCFWDQVKFQVQRVDYGKQFMNLRISEPGHMDWNRMTSPWCIAGDFNAYLFSHEKRGGTPGRVNGDAGFFEFMEDSGLLDLGFSGNKFTWKGGDVEVKLDRVIANLEWRRRFGDASVTHLAKLKSDHTPLWIRMGRVGNCNLNSRPFRFLAACLIHEDFERLMGVAWKRSESWSNTISEFTNALNDWNMNVFWNIFSWKRRLLARLQGIKDKLGNGGSLRLLDTKREVWKEYEEVLFQEEIHDSTIIRRRRNKIDSLMNEAGDWVYEDAELKKIVVDYYCDLYKEEVPDYAPAAVDSGFPGLSDREVRMLGSNVGAEEVKNVVFHIGDLKAPGPDGLQALFYKSQWRVVGDDVFRLVANIFYNPEKIGEINHTLLVLIPKVKVLRAKYKYGEDLVPVVNKQRSSSNLWKVVVDCWDKDMLELKVVDYVDRNGCWDATGLSKVLPDYVIKKILAVLVPCDVLCNDFLCWSLTGNGNFLVKSAYEGISRTDQDDGWHDWMKIWKWRGPQKVKTFMWLAAKERLLTNQVRWRRGSKLMWRRLVHPRYWGEFFQLSITDWIGRNLSKKWGVCNEDWDIMFGIYAWLIWCWRNDEVVGDRKYVGIDKVLAIIWRTREVPPDLGWVKLNVDGMGNEASKVAGCGGVCGGVEADFLRGFVQNLGDCNVLSAELWAILSGLRLLWNGGYKKVMVDSDSMDAVRLINDAGSAGSCNNALVNRIVNFLKLDGMLIWCM
ncbi:ribonuclease H [Senna tora]|uniref:Ribonuclease H n=1 Tax=Senna tora TaxID=362788 RepID=A0A834U1I6_9FABA|nr:ribonuclease H [Senna tora]